MPFYYVDDDHKPRRLVWPSLWIHTPYTPARRSSSHYCYYYYYYYYYDSCDATALGDGGDESSSPVPLMRRHTLALPPFSSSSSSSYFVPSSFMHYNGRPSSLTFFVPSPSLHYGLPTPLLCLPTYLPTYLPTPSNYLPTCLTNFSSLFTRLYQSTLAALSLTRYVLLFSENLKISKKTLLYFFPQKIILLLRK